VVSIKLSDRFYSESTSRDSKTDVELLAEDLPTSWDEQDVTHIIDSLAWKDKDSSATGFERTRTPRLLVFSCMDLRREVFFVRSEMIGRILGKLVQKMAEPQYCWKAVEAFARSNLVFQKLSRTPSEVLLDRLNRGEKKTLWAKTQNIFKCVLYPQDVIFPSTVTPEVVNSVSVLYNRNAYPQPASVSKKTGAVLWRVSSLVRTESSLEPLANFFLSAQTRNLPFLILAAGNKPDYASYLNRLKVPEGVFAGCKYLVVPGTSEILSAFGELLSHCFGGPSPPTFDIIIQGAEEDTTGITLLEEEGKIEDGLACSSDSLKNWLQQSEDSAWYCSISQILAAAKVIIEEMEEGKHVFLGSSVSSVIVSLTFPILSTHTILFINFFYFSPVNSCRGDARARKSYSSGLLPAS
jgi:hypothetical protein